MRAGGGVRTRSLAIRALTGGPALAHSLGHFRGPFPWSISVAHFRGRIYFDRELQALRISLCYLRLT